MLKRHIAILIVGGLLGAQANLAGAGDNNVEILPAQLKYLEARAARVRAETQGDVYKEHAVAVAQAVFTSPSD